MLANLVNVDKSLAKRVADGLAMPLPDASPTTAPVREMELSPALRLIEGPHTPQSIAGRSIGILIADGSDAKAVAKLGKQVTDAGGRPIVIAPKVGGAKMADGSLLKADAQLAGFPSVFVDAIALVLSAEGTKALLNEAAAVQFVMDAFSHLKAIAHTPDAQPLLDKAGVKPDAGVGALDEGFFAAAAKRYWDREPGVRTLA
jgi:catalase